MIHDAIGIDINGKIKGFSKIGFTLYLGRENLKAIIINNNSKISRVLLQNNPNLTSLIIKNDSIKELDLTNNKNLKYFKLNHKIEAGFFDIELENKIYNIKYLYLC